MFIRLVIALIFVCGAAIGQHNVILMHPVESTGGGGPPATTWLYEDDFESYSNGDINDQGLWSDEMNGATVSENVSGDSRVGMSTASAENAIFYDAAVASNMIVQMEIDSTQGGRGIGPAVRCQGGTSSYYGWYSTLSESYLIKVISGVYYELAKGDVWSIGDVIRLEVDGQELSCYRNGSLDTSVDTDGLYTVTGTTLTDGYGGICGYAAAAYGLGDNWKAKNQ